VHWRFQNYLSPDYVVISAGGTFNATGFGNMLEDLFRLEYWRPRIPLLLDESELDVTPVTPDQLVRAAELFLDQNARLAYTRIAIVLGSSAAMRIAERFRRAVNSQTKTVLEIFLDKQTALEWLVFRV
jgi:hypothetical protein